MKKLLWIALGAAAAIGIYVYVKKAVAEKAQDSEVDKLIAWYEKTNIHNDDLAAETMPTIVT